ncbi:MAG TPA: hypothetical protein VLA56_17665 [Pseudomonadales bacterium]|nr:hypothetical protein [Pseudomonadales bacterium]
MNRTTPVLLLLAASLACGACLAGQTLPQGMAPLFQLDPTDAADLAEQTRIYPTTDRDAVLSASAAALQDMGFGVTGGERAFGVLVASKTADVEGAGVGHALAEGALVATTLMLSLLVGEDLVTDLPEQVSQEIHVSLLVSAARGGAATAVRISLDRDMHYDHGYSIPDHTELPLVYADFFEHLSRAVYLEGERL